MASFITRFLAGEPAKKSKSTATKKQTPKRRAPKTSFGKGPNRMVSAAKGDAKRRRNVMAEIRKTRGQ